MIGSLFSGCGALDIAVSSALRSQVAWHFETDPAASQVLSHHWPDIPNYGDVTGMAWSSVEPVDVLTGGFPCTDVSSAGKRAGLRAGTRSGLWSHMATAIDHLRPQLVVIENVRGLTSACADCDVELCSWCMGDEPGVYMRALGAVLGDLADLGYDTRWCGLRAADVGAPHGRFRVFIAAHPAGQPRFISNGEYSIASDPEGDRWDQRRTQPEGELWGFDAAERGVWGKYEPAIRRWETVLGRGAPAPTERGMNGPVLSPAFVEWMQGLPDGYVTAVPGLDCRSDQLRILGNCVVPQQAMRALSVVGIAS